MKYEDVEVKSHGTVVEIIRVPIYESMQELASIDGEDVLAGYNRQIRADLINQARAEAARPKSLNQKPRRAQIDPEIVTELKKILTKYGTNRGCFSLFMRRIRRKVREFFNL